MGELTYWLGGPEGLSHLDADRPLSQLIERIPAGGFLWVDVDTPDTDQLAEVASLMRLHPFAIRDATQPHERSKYDDYSAVHTIVIKTLRQDAGTIVGGDLTALIGDPILLTARHRGPDLSGVRRFLNEHPHMMSDGTWAPVYAILHQALERYQDLSDETEEQVSKVERRVFSGGRVDAVGDIYSLQRRVVEIREALNPLLPIAEDALSGDHRPSFRDVAHRLRRLDNAVAASELQLDHILNAHLGQISMWQNEDMRKISAWGAIITVPTLIAGIYGMNFRHIPELGWFIGYPLVLMLMIAVCLLLYRGFRRNGWL